MAFGIGINNENQDAGMIRGSQQDTKGKNHSTNDKGTG